MTVKEYYEWIISLTPEERKALVKSCDPFVDPSEESEDSEDSEDESN